MARLAEVMGKPVQSYARREELLAALEQSRRKPRRA